ETAMSEARKRLLVTGFELEWANPVLFFRGNDGNLFSTRPYSARELIRAPRPAAPGWWPETTEAAPPDMEYEAAEYQRLATSRTPALVVYVIDTSASMAERTRSGTTRLDLVSDALRASIGTMIRRSLIGGTVSPRYRVAMFSYSEGTEDLLDGIRSIAEVARNGIPRLQTGRATNAASAFIEVENLLHAEIPKIQEGPAPLVCHVTDGNFTGGDLRPYLKAIRGLRVEDGNVLVSTVLVTEQVLAQPIGQIERWRGISSATDLRPGYARVFEGSSEIPGSYRASIVEAGYDLAPRARMIFPAAYPEIMQLAVTLSAATRVA
ncbi:MAG: vWA domain-containing protein, partial [Gammaproteobacteria bacterium]